VRERDLEALRRAVGAGASPADPEPRGEAPDDVVAAVAEFVDDLVDGPDGPSSTG
jgi:hypothetical protein